MIDLAEYVEHFRARVVQDALNEATASYWLRRAEAFEAVRPRPGDFTGRASAEELNDQRVRVALTIAACRQRASVALIQDVQPDVVEAVREAAA